MEIPQTEYSECSEQKDLYECKQCSRIFCSDHLKDHREILN